MKVKKLISLCVFCAFLVTSCAPSKQCFNHVKITKLDNSVVWFKTIQESRNPDVDYNEGSITVWVKDLTESTYIIVAKEISVGVSCPYEK